MAKNKKKKNEESGKKKGMTFKEGVMVVRNFFMDGRVQYMIGVVIAVLAVFLCSSFVSFLTSGGNDQTVVEAVSAGVSDSADVATNSSGKGGAMIADYFVNGCFGWASFLIFPLLILCSLKLMYLRTLKLGRWTILLLSGMLWLSVLFSFVFGDGYDSSFVSPGGKHGTHLTSVITDYVGSVGVVLLLVLALLFIMVYFTRDTITWLQKLWPFSDEEDALDEPAVADDEDADAVEDEEESESEPVPAPGIVLAVGDEPEEKPASETEIPITGADSMTDEEIAAKLDELNRKMEEQEGAGGNDVVIDIAEEPVADEEPVVSDKSEALEDVNVAEDVPVEQNETGQKEVADVGGAGLVMEMEKADGDEDMGGDMFRPINPKDELSYYKPPTIDLLDEYEQAAHAIDRNEQAANANRIVEVLKNFGIEISSIKATVGPTITLYEITPAPGVRISKIRNLEDDIAMSLSALCIRIVAPIPGKGTIGIEVPNTHKQIVPMASLLNSRKYKETDMALPLALGKTISNEVYMVDMAKMPHLLVAGATGMGKSVGLNAIITSLLYKMHPAYLKFVMVDPKMVELSLYGVLEKHFLAKLEGEDEPIITDVNKVVRTLKSLCVEMDNRYKLLQMASVRSVKEYNEKYLNKELLPTKGHRFMPYIVVIIDEYGDLMMTAGREVEQPIARIAQKARAVGIHMIIATQRPTTNIITGTIKANFPARMAFRVISAIDSRTILDRSGANQLQGRGDMLFLAGNDPVRVQCALVETKEVERVCAHIAKQQGYLRPYILPEPEEASEFGDGGGGGARGEITSDKLDPLFADAARAVVLAQHGSTSLIQRKFNVGFNRAGRIMDQLCQTGIVGEQEGSKPRQVLCADEADLEFRLKSIMS